LEAKNAIVLDQNRETYPADAYLESSAPHFSNSRAAKWQKTSIENCAKVICRFPFEGQQVATKHCMPNHLVLFGQEREKRCRLASPRKRGLRQRLSLRKKGLTTAFYGRQYADEGVGGACVVHWRQQDTTQ